MSIASAILEHYDLKDNPFDHRFKDPLRESDVALYARVDGFAKQVPPLENWFQRPANLAQSATFLVHGPRGCGRSSVVGYVVALFAEAKRRADSQAAIVVLSAAAKDAEEMRPVLDLLTNLYNQVAASELAAEIGAAELLKLFEDHVLDAQEESANLRRLQSIFSRTMAFLSGKQKQRHPAVVLEDIEKFKQIDSLRNVFKDAPLTIVSTADDQISRDFGNAGYSGMVVEVGQLTFQDIVDFVSQRWAAVSKGDPPKAPHPFELNGLQRVFAVKQAWEFKGVVGLLTEIFDRHVDTLQSAPLLPPAPARMNQNDMYDWAYNYAIRRGI